MKHRLWVLKGGSAPALVTVDAPSSSLALQKARADGYVCLAAARRPALAEVVARPRLNVGLFTEELLALLAAGLSVVEAMEALREGASIERAAVLGLVLESLREGRSFAASIERAGSFPDLLVSLVRASERTSDLPEALRRYLAYHREMDAARQQVISAALYPALVTSAGIAAIFFLLLYVVPRFTGIYEGMHGNLPWSATLMLQWGRFLRDHGWQMGIALGGAVGSTGLLLTNRTLRGRLASLALRLPLVGEHASRFHLARFYRTAGMLLQAGLSIVRTLEMSMPLLPAHLRVTGQGALRAISQGQRPSVAFNRAGLTTAIAERILLVGERSGDLGGMMTRIAEFYELSTSRELGRAMRVLEPALMTLIGLGIGIVILLIYLPIFELAGAIQ